MRRTPPTDTLAQGNCAQRESPTQGSAGEAASAPQEQSYNHEQLTGDDLALEEHIRTCSAAWRRSYALFQKTGDAAARVLAVHWLHEQNKAILRRSPAVLAARESAFQRSLDESVGYFIDAGDRDRARVSSNSTGKGDVA